MYSFYTRSKDFLRRAVWLNFVIQNWLRTVQFMLAVRQDLNAYGHGMYGAYRIAFRGCDIGALKEVLVDQEYAFLYPYITDKPNPVIVDVGAHIGTFALAMLHANPGAKILSLEADPDTYEILTRNARGVADWLVVYGAAWGGEEDLAFSTEGVSMSHKVQEGGTLKVPGMPLINLLERAGGESINLMKIDIEGAEEAFLCAAPEALQHVERLVIELHPHHCNTDRVMDVLRGQYNVIENVGGRTSTKPLLYCYNQGRHDQN